MSRREASSISSAIFCRAQRSALRESARVAFGKSRLKALGGLSETELRATFTKFDTSKDGQLDETELKVALRVVTGADLPLSECKKLVLAADKTGDGLINFKDFKMICSEMAGK